MPEQTATNAAKGRAAAKARRQAVTHNGGAASTPYRAGGRPAKAQPAAASAKPSGLSGRELARARRAAMTTSGKNGVATAPSAAPFTPPPAAAPGPAPVVAASVAKASTPPAAVLRVETPADLAGLSGRELARARRALQARGGKLAPAKGSASASRPRTRPNAPSAPVVAPAAAAMETQSASANEEDDTDNSELDQLCEIAQSNPSALGPDANSVRQWCRERRQALSTRGKKALPRMGQTATRAPGSGRRNGTHGLQGREAALAHRAQQCRNGRGNSPACRPTGRQRPNAGDAPAKVETGTTLSGRSVSGTQVERKERVTGNEPGTCRTITGTEYVGAEQFDRFCETRPKPGVPKVGTSITSGGRSLTGTEIGRSRAVTGDEAGDCRSVTGTEYLGSERFDEFCETKGLHQQPAKVAIGMTERLGLSISGADSARTGAVTGQEAGSGRAITGSQYSDGGAARTTINGPAKVALTHTIAGRPVSGTEVGRSVQVTGDEAGSCRQISGTEYLSNEQFTTICDTRPTAPPAKVGVDESREGQRITGNLVDRSERVTGNEPGSCQKVTGSQYGRSTLCGGGPDKVQRQQTLAGRALTGSRVDHGPKMTGDEQGGCKPVTGTEYYGREQYDTYCESTPMPAAAKVGISESQRGLPVSGTPMGRSGNVTGAEPGSGLAISGTPYSGREQLTAAPSAPPMPNLVRREPPRASTRYQAPAGQPLPQPAPAPQAPAVTPADFSIVSPARYAQEKRERITGTAYAGGGRITGPVNMAAGLVSGTPEFRYRDEEAEHGPAVAMQPRPERGPQRGQGRAQERRPEPMIPQPAEVEAEAEVVSRVTGDGHAASKRITGDDWARGNLVTGTEGHWAGRNPTQRGANRGMAVGARVNKEIERPAPAPTTNITGSSGNHGAGAMITVSGGARG